MKLAMQWLPVFALSNRVTIQRKPRGDG